MLFWSNYKTSFDSGMNQQSLVTLTQLFVQVCAKYSKSPHIRTYKNKNLDAVFIAGVAKLIFDCC